jgi:hypothetical protein
VCSVTGTTEARHSKTRRVGRTRASTSDEAVEVCALKLRAQGCVS